MKHIRACYKLITFDVTNTLLKFKIPVGEQYASIGRKYGIKRNSDQITSSFLNHWKTMNHHYPNFGSNLGMTSYTWWKMLVEKTFHCDDEKISPQQLEKLSSHLYELYKTDACWEVVTGTISVLELLKNENVKIGVISNFDERLESVLSACGLRNYFDFVLTSYEARVPKPNRAIFDMALNKTNCLASQALHVGDDFNLDYLAAKRAGWNAVLIADKIKLRCLPEEAALTDIVEDISRLKSCLC